MIFPRGARVESGPGAGSGRETNPRTRRMTWMGPSLILLSLSVWFSLAESQPAYTLDKDPIRIGRRALEEGRLADAAGAFEEALAASYQVHKAAFGLAEVAVRQGRLGEAESLYRRAVETGERLSGDGYPEARAALGLLLLRSGRSAEAEAEAEITAALLSDPDLWTAVYGRARLHLEREQWQEAKVLLDRGAGRRGVKEGEDAYHHGMALYRLGMGELRDAEKEALLALAQNAALPEHAMLVGRIYQMRGTPALAIDAFETALAAPGSTPTAPLLQELGRLYEHVGRYTEARDHYLRATEVDSMYAPALKDLAELLRRGKQYDTAARTYLRYLTIEPNDLDGLLGLSASCLETRRYDEAFRAARTAMELDSTRADTRLALVRSGIRSGDPAAKAEAARIGSDLPDSLDWSSQDHVLLSVFDTEAGRYDRAARSLERALALDPGNPEIHFQRGMLALKTHDPRSAIPLFEQAIGLAPDEALYHLNLGIARLQAQEARESLGPLRRALELNPDLTVGRLLLAQALASSDSLRAAEAEYRRVLQDEPGNAKALRGLGFCAIQRADYEGAAGFYRKAAGVEPDNADAWGGLGSAYLGLQDWSAAEDAFRRARAIDPENRTAKRGFELLERARGSPKGE
jgi:tetratricopeptide (TPR) repeat protein